MSKEELLPELRFEEFSAVWEKRTLGELGNVAMNKRIFKNQTSEKGEIPFYKIGTFGKEPDAYISRELFDEYKSKYSYPKIGDILISASGSIGRTVEYKGGDEYFQDSNIVWLNHNGKIDNHFLKQFYKIVTWHGLEGSTIKRLYNSNILNTEIILPILEEQEKIGSFFKKLDQMIQVQQSKVNKVKDIKSAYLSEMFPKEGEKYPKKRFEGLKNNWNPATFSDFLKTESFKKYLAKEDRNGIFPIIQQGDSPIEGYGDGIPYKDYDSVVLFGDHTLSLYRPESPFLIASDGIKILSNNKMDRDYFYYLLQRYIPESEGYKRHYSILKNKVINITENKEEQVKIGNFFKNLDNQISIEEEKLVKLEKLKQAYLNEMFV